MNATRCGKTEFRWGERTYVMGIVNLSPDSFSGDGLADTGAAIGQAQRLVAEGADILDIGGESTRPGAGPVAAEKEIRRVVPVIERLAGQIAVPLSVDTSKSAVARPAVAAGAAMINDQWGLKRDPALADLAASAGVPIVLMSNQRDRGVYDADINRDTAEYGDVVAVVKASLGWSLQAALERGVPPDNIILDPGIGFGKKWQQELELIRCLADLCELGRPILVGPSRKSFIGMVLDLAVGERVEGTAAAVAIAVANGADMIRVHDVRQMARVARMADAITRRSS